MQWNATHSPVTCLKNKWVKRNNYNHSNLVYKKSQILNKWKLLHSKGWKTTGMTRGPCRPVEEHIAKSSGPENQKVELSKLSGYYKIIIAKTTFFQMPGVIFLHCILAWLTLQNPLSSCKKYISVSVKFVSRIVGFDTKTEMGAGAAMRSIQ